MSRLPENARDEFVSEPIRPIGEGFDTSAMGRGEPGLPRAFAWRGQSHRVVERLAVWKESEREHGRAAGELYLRRHCYRLRMEGGDEWTVYFARQPIRGSTPKTRWFLYSIAAAKDRPEGIGD